MKNGLILAALLSVASTSVMAIEITVTNTTCGLVPAACDALDAEIEREIESFLPSINISDYANGIANSNSSAQAGLNSDYSDRFETALIKVAPSLAVQGDLDTLRENISQAEGVSASASATFGLNLNVLDYEKLGPLDLSKLDIFLSIGAFSPIVTIDNTRIDGKVRNFSFMARYQIVDAKDIIPGYLLHWGGISLHTGLQYANFKADILSTIADQTVEAGGETANVTNTSANIKIDTTTFTLPIEVSTSLRTVWALTLFGGAGFDLVTGSSDVSLNASGEAQNGALYGASITANDSANGSPQATNLRAFAGLQVNLPYVRLYAQLNKSLGANLVGANGGLKILW